MTNYVINGKIILPKKIFLDQTKWYLEGLEDNKRVVVNLHEIGSFDGKFIDEVVIIRPLTNRIYVDQKTNDVLKIHVDHKDAVLFMAHENRQMAENRPTVSLDLDNLNDSLIRKKRKKIDVKRRNNPME